MYRLCYVAAPLLLAGVFLVGATMGDTRVGPEASLPEKTNGWTSLPDYHKVYDRETLYDYIDGGAELYLSYGFRRLTSRRYVREGEPDIVVDLFDMGDSHNAFGVFSHSREVVESRFGQGSQYTEGLLLFWKGRYYVSVLASPETEASRGAAFDLARRIERTKHPTVDESQHTRRAQEACNRAPTYPQGELAAFARWRGNVLSCGIHGCGSQSSINRSGTGTSNSFDMRRASPVAPAQRSHQHSGRHSSTAEERASNAIRVASGQRVPVARQSHVAPDVALPRVDQESHSHCRFW